MHVVKVISCGLNVDLMETTRTETAKERNINFVFSSTFIQEIFHSLTWAIQQTLSLIHVQI